MLTGRTILVTGASRGLGKAIALRCSRLGANVALMGRSAERPAHNSLQSTLNDVAFLISNSNGGNGLVLPIDLSCASSSEVEDAVDLVHSKFGSVDALVLNASAMSIEKVPSLKTYELMMNVNVRSSYMMITKCLPYLTNSDVGHVLCVSPPLYALDDRWMRPHPAYTTSKYAMSILTLGYSDILRANTIWPSKLYRTAATRRLQHETGVRGYTYGLTPSLFAKATTEVLCGKRRGEQLLDSDLLHIPTGAIDSIFIP